MTYLGIPRLDYYCAADWVAFYTKEEMNDDYKIEFIK